MSEKLAGLKSSSTPLTIEKKGTLARWSAWILILLMLLLRVILLGWVPILAEKEFSWIEPAYQIGTYAAGAALLILNREQLADYHFDRLALLMFLLFKPVQTLILPLMSRGTPFATMAFPHPTALAIWAIAVILVIALRPAVRQAPGKIPAIRASNWGWLLSGGLIGPVLALIFGFLLLPWSTIRQVTPIYDITLLLAFPYQIGYAGVDEEPLFRGWLWGQLRKSGWREGGILVFQAAVFMLAHGRLLTDIANLPFALAIFLGGIAFGLLVMRSRSVATSMIAHGFYNASSIFVYYLLSGLFAS